MGQLPTVRGKQSMHQTQRRLRRPRQQWRYHHRAYASHDAKGGDNHTHTNGNCDPTGQGCLLPSNDGHSPDTRSWYSYDSHGILVQTAPLGGSMETVVPNSLRPRLFYLALYSKVAGHPGEGRMHDAMRRALYWPHMAATFTRQ